LSISRKCDSEIVEVHLPRTETRLEHTVFGLQVFDECFLLSRKPRSEHDEQKLYQRRRLSRAASLYQAAPSCSLDLGQVF